MKAMGNDGRWHEWDELSPEEQQEWTRCMTLADKRWDEQKVNGKEPTLFQNLLEYESSHRILRW